MPMRVLLVEDNPDDAALTRRAVLKAVPETEIQLARDGQEALDYFDAEDSSRPDLVLLDLKLPRLDGIEVLRRLRKNHNLCFLPIVMLTSSDERSDVVACYSEGVNSYLRKPVDFDEFMVQVGGAARYWLSSNIVPPLDR